MSRPLPDSSQIPLKLACLTLAQKSLPQHLGRIVVIRFGRHLEGQGEQPPPPPRGVIAEVPEPGGKGRPALHHEANRRPETHQSIEHLFAPGAVSHDHALHGVGLDPLPGKIVELSNADHPPCDHAFGATYRHPALFRTWVDGQDLHRYPEEATLFNGKSR
jgi:hypothetical protein